jgi:hypothetical protein
MINLNIVSRISDDKCFFIDTVYAIHRLKKEHNIDAQIYFIGAIENYGIYNTLVRLVEILNLQDRIFFSKRSIWIEDLPDDVKEGYFINYSIGEFFGYSGVDCLKSKLKTIFLNIDAEYNSMIRTDYKCYCADINTFIRLLKEIEENGSQIANQLLQENEVLFSEYYLGSEEKELLKSVLLDLAVENMEQKK